MYFVSKMYFDVIKQILELNLFKCVFSTGNPLISYMNFYILWEVKLKGKLIA